MLTIGLPLATAENACIANRSSAIPTRNPPIRTQLPGLNSHIAAVTNLSASPKASVILDGKVTPPPPDDGLDPPEPPSTPGAGRTATTKVSPDIGLVVTPSAVS